MCRRLQANDKEGGTWNQGASENFFMMSPFSFQPPTDLDVNGSVASSLASSPHPSEGSQPREKEHNTPETEAAGEALELDVRSLVPLASPGHLPGASSPFPVTCQDMGGSLCYKKGPFIC